MNYLKYFNLKFLTYFCFSLILFSIIFLKRFNKKNYTFSDLTPSLRLNKDSIESTLIECMQFSDLTSFCLYENICMKNNHFYFLTNNRTLQNTPFKHNGQINTWDHYQKIDNFGKTIEIPRNNPLPFRSFIHGSYENPSIWQKSKIFHKGCHSVLKFDSDGQNIFHWSIKITPLFIYLNFHRRNSCPKLDSIRIINRKYSDLSDWQRNFLKISTDVEEIDINFEQTNLQCYQTMLIPGTAIYLFTGPQEAINFRRKVGKKLKLEFKRFRIVLVKRKTRLIVNQQELENFIESKIGKKYLDIIYFENLDFEQQVKIMSKAKLFISMHGAALTNSIFMPSTSILLEITAPHFHYPLYERVAIQSGHIYFRFVTDPDPSIHSNKFINITSRECFSIMDCKLFWKNQNVRVNITKFAFLFEQIMEVL